MLCSVGSGTLHTAQYVSYNTYMLCNLHGRIYVMQSMPIDAGLRQLLWAEEYEEDDQRRERAGIDDSYTVSTSKREHMEAYSPTLNVMLSSIMCRL
eukprot:2754161-Pyramimonas_sp.AAC.1